MNRERLRKFLGVIVAIAGAILAILSTLAPNLGTVLVGGLAVIAGRIVYVGIGRDGNQSDRQLLRQYGGVIMILAGVLIVGLSALEGNPGYLLLGVPATLFGAIVYLGISRYGEQFSRFRESTIDYRTRPAVAYTVVQIFGFGVLFASIFYLAASTDFVTTSIADITSAPPWVIGIGVVPGVVLGAGYPAFIQRQTIVPRLNVARIGFGLDNNLSIGVYFLLLVGPEPAATVFYAIALLVSRFASLVTIFSGARRQTTSS